MILVYQSPRPECQVVTSPEHPISASQLALKDETLKSDLYKPVRMKSSITSTFKPLREVVYFRRPFV